MLRTPAVQRNETPGRPLTLYIGASRAEELHWDFWELCSGWEGMEQGQQPSWRGWNGAGDLPGCQGGSSVLLTPSCIRQQKNPTG